jgi:molybdenum cofactor guanylyltransferase
MTSRRHHYRAVMTFDAVVLTGGDARRLGGVDKATIDVGGLSLLERSLGAVQAAERVIAVGPRRLTSIPVQWTTEVPAGGGPLRATIEGLKFVTSEVAVVLAVDYPFVTSEVIASLLSAAAGHDGAALGDASGQMHYVVGAYWTYALRVAIAERSMDESSMRSLFANLDVAGLRNERAALDIDTPEDLERARAHAAEP